VILNDVAWSITKSQRGTHPIWVFPYHGRRMKRMNNNGWQQARYEARLPLVRVHALRHSFACRLRASGVSAEDREALLGHANHSMAGHYASADVGHLLRQANLVLNRSGTQTVLRVADSWLRQVVGIRRQPRGSGFARQVHESQHTRKDRWTTRSTEVPQQTGGPGFECLKFGAPGRIRTHDPPVRSSMNGS